MAKGHNATVQRGARENGQRGTRARGTESERFLLWGYKKNNTGYNIICTYTKKEKTA